MVFNFHKRIGRSHTDKNAKFEKNLTISAISNSVPQPPMRGNYHNQAYLSQ
ncbi:hypothetical protein [Nodularia chucula]|uniref:hypothetical protein n=1 Tax=Nodularia chucula TaxID=3093667 RepID=UPI0039C71CF4